MNIGDTVRSTLRGVTREKMEVMDLPGDGTVVLRYCRGFGSSARRKDGTVRKGGTNKWLIYGWRVVHTAEERMARELMGR